MLLALRVAVSLGVVIAAIWLLQRRMSRGRATRAGRPISVIARQNLGPKASVAVVDFGGKRFLLGVTEHGVTVLHDAVAETVAAETEEPIVSGQARQSSRDFAEALSLAQNQGTATRRPAPASVAMSRDTGLAPALPLSAPASRLSGSILSAATWKQAWTAVRGER